MKPARREDLTSLIWDRDTRAEQAIQAGFDWENEKASAFTARKLPEQSAWQIALNL